MLAFNFGIAREHLPNSGLLSESKLLEIVTGRGGWRRALGTGRGARRADEGLLGLDGGHKACDEDCSRSHDDGVLVLQPSRADMGRLKYCLHRVLRPLSRVKPRPRKVQWHSSSRVGNLSTTEGERSLPGAMSRDLEIDIEEMC